MMKSKALAVAAVLLGLTLGACDSTQAGKSTGRLQTTVRINGLAGAVAQVKVSITCSDPAASAIAPLVLTAGLDQTYTGTFSQLRVSSNGGPTYDLTAEATDAGNVVLYRGTAPGVVVTEQVLATVVIVADSTALPVFNTIPAVLPPAMPSQPFQAQQTAEFGDYITLAPGTGRHAFKATAVMVTWATVAYSHPITLNLYSSSGGGLTSIGTRTQTFDIPARPAGDPTCPDTGYGAGFAWRASDGKCYNGLAFTITFDLSGVSVVLPDSFAYGLAYNTNTWGYSPIGQPGPYESLNVGVIGDGSAASSTQPSIGTDPHPDTVLRNYWDFAPVPQGYTGFVPESGWTGYAPAVEFLAY